MKKQLLAPFLGLLCAATITSTSFAQTTASASVPASDKNFNFDYSLALNNNTPSAARVLSPNEVTTKATRSFDKSFKEATNAKWYAIDKKTYLATFTHKDGRESRALFAKNGYIYYAISFGNEQSLPKEERRNIKSNYVDYNIGRVSEVSALGQKVWVVNLQDADNLVIARSADGALDELEHYQTHAKTTKKGRVIIPQ